MITVEFFGGPWDGVRKQVEGPLSDDWLVPLKADWPDDYEVPGEERRRGRVGRYLLGWDHDGGVHPYRYEGEI